MQKWWKKTNGDEVEKRNGENEFQSFNKHIPNEIIIELFLL